MHKTISSMKIFLLTISSLLLISCNIQDNEIIPKEITIAGRISNYDKNSGKTILTIYVNDHGRADQLSFPTKVDTLGNFNVKFNRYYAQDVMISYKTNFQVIVHPGDSLYVEFNGDTRDRIKIFETVKYSGNSVELNEKLSIYLKKYFESRPSTSLIHQKEKDLNPSEYLYFLDSIRTSRNHRKNVFVEKYNPGEELLSWIDFDIELSYYENLFDYPSSHRRYNKLSSKEWTVEREYYDFVKALPVLDHKTLIYADSRWIINRYLGRYIVDIAWEESDSIAKANPDSLIFFYIINQSPSNGLIKQLILNELINNTLSKYEVSLYENYKNEITEIITENFLIEPLVEHYNEVKTILAKPVLAKDIVLNNISDKSSNELWNKILSEGNGKVIYIDCWATWCGACISEFPRSKLMMEEYKNKDIDFVYLCLRSKMEEWKTVLADKKLSGKHYLLNDEQSAFFEQLLKINSYPTYIIIDKEGKIIRLGYSFRPKHESTERIINELL